MESALSERGHNNDDLDNVDQTVSGLKDDVTALAGELEGSASDAVRRTLSRIEATVADLYETVAEQGGRSVEAIERQVDERPWTSLLVAFGLGWVIGRLASRD